MLLIGNQISLMRPALAGAISRRDDLLVRTLARHQVEAGASWLLVDVGPQRKNAAADLAWLVQTIHAEIRVPLVLRSDDPTALQAGLEVAKERTMIDATLPGVAEVGPYLELAGQFASRLALPACPAGLPRPTDERIVFVVDTLLPMISDAGLAIEDVYVDPVITALTCDQTLVPATVETMRLLKVGADQPPNTLVHLDNITDGVAEAARPYVSQAYLTMLLSAGLDALVANVLDFDLMDVLRVVRDRDPSGAYDRLLLRLYDLCSVDAELDRTMIDPSDVAQVGLFKTVQVLTNKVLYADSYLRVW
jgi:cobalamin-dependent methionine synthase I